MASLPAQIERDDQKAEMLTGVLPSGESHVAVIWLGPVPVTVTLVGGFGPVCGIKNFHILKILQQTNQLYDLNWFGLERVTCSMFIVQFSPFLEIGEARSICAPTLCPSRNMAAYKWDGGNKAMTATRIPPKGLSKTTLLNCTPQGPIHAGRFARKFHFQLLQVGPA